MSGRTPTRVAWALAGLALGLLAASAAYRFGDAGQAVFAVALTLMFSVVGALIASRHPGNAIGWIFLAVAVATGLGGVAGAYADHWLSGDGGSQALGETAAWYATLSWIPFILVPCTFLLLLFPDGRLPSRRWRWVAWCAGAGIVGGLLTSGVKPGPLEDYPQLDNPYGIDSALLDPLTGLAVLTLVIGIVGSSASLVVRFRRARGELRDQIKWLALAGAFAGLIVPIAAAGSELWGDIGTNIASMLGVLSLPLAAAIAILRHRLYDIDVVINRTLVYGALTATLGGTYLGLVRADRAGGGPVRSCDRRLDARCRGAVPARPCAHPSRRGPPLLPPPLRRGADTRGVRRATCATSSISRRWRTTCAGSCATPSRPPISRCGCGERLVTIRGRMSRRKEREMTGLIRTFRRGLRRAPAQERGAATPPRGSRRRCRAGRHRAQRPAARLPAERERGGRHRGARARLAGARASSRPRASSSRSRSSARAS